MGTLVQYSSYHIKGSPSCVFKIDCYVIEVKFKMAWAYYIRLGYIYQQGVHRIGSARGGQCAREVGQGGCTGVGRARTRSGGLGWSRAVSGAQARCRIDRRPRGAAPSAPRVATRTPGCAPRRWRRERAPAASGGHAAMAREVTTRPPLAPPTLRPLRRDWLTRPETWLLSWCPRPLGLPTSRPPTADRRAIHAMQPVLFKSVLVYILCTFVIVSFHTFRTID